MLSGFNHNIRYQGLLFHVQTEDAGDQKAYVVTTLFFSGNVVASRRSSFEKFTGLKERDEIVTAMMKDQHKEMLKDLVENRLRSVQMLFREKVKKENRIGKPAEQTFASAGEAEKPASRTLDTDATAEKSLDELIGEFFKNDPSAKS